MRIAIICEGETEKAFFPILREFLKNHLAGQMPKLDPVPQHGRIPTKQKLARLVERLLSDRKHPADAVIGLTDLYTGSNPPEFSDALDAKAKMLEWVGRQEFYPHVALHDFEAWLLPYWEKIQRIAGNNLAPFGAHPEEVNHNNPPAHRLRTMFRAGKAGINYVKPRDAARILRGEDLLVAAKACPEFKAFLNRILELCGANPII